MLNFIHQKNLFLQQGVDLIKENSYHLLQISKANQDFLHSCAKPVWKHVFHSFATF